MMTDVPLITTQEPSPPSPPPPAEDPLKRYVLVLSAIVLTVGVLYFAHDLFILLFAAGLFAFLLLPLTQFLQRKRFPLWLASLLSCLLMVVSVAAVVWFIAYQYAGFGDDLPALERAVEAKWAALQTSIEQRFHFTKTEQSQWLRKRMDGISAGAGSMAMAVVSSTGSVLAVLLLLPIFTFFLLLLKGKFRTFFSQLSNDHSDTVLKVVERISDLSRKYMKGVVTVMVILSVLNSIGFMLLGLKYAVLMGVTAAVLNVIPYVGPWIGSLIPISLALLTKDSVMYAFGALGVVLITQFIDNNFITPKVVGSSVSINPLASIVALFIGGLLWGVVGLVFAIPITGMLKIICDEVPGLRAWGFLLGEEHVYPVEGRFVIPFFSPRSATPKPPEEPSSEQ
jgi:predicted PurR-regulated permease PerM